MHRDTTHLLRRLRSLMKQRDIIPSNINNLSAYIIPSSDSHGSEYLNEKDKRRSFMTNFTGAN